MTNSHARLLASALALVAAAILAHAHERAGVWVVFLTGALFVVEYGRASLPDRGNRADPGAIRDRRGE